MGEGWWPLRTGAPQGLPGAQSMQRATCLGMSKLSLGTLPPSRFQSGGGTLKSLIVPPTSHSEQSRLGRVGSWERDRQLSSEGHPVLHCMSHKRGLDGPQGSWCQARESLGLVTGICVKSLLSCEFPTTRVRGPCRKPASLLLKPLGRREGVEGDVTRTQRPSRILLLLRAGNTEPLVGDTEGSEVPEPPGTEACSPGHPEWPVAARAPSRSSSRAFENRQDRRVGPLSPEPRSPLRGRAPRRVPGSK